MRNTVSQINHEPLLKSFDYDLPLAREAFKIFQDHIHHEVAELSNAIKCSEYNEAIRITHKIKGMVANFSELPCQDAANHLHHAIKNKNQNQIQSSLAHFKRLLLDFEKHTCSLLQSL